MGSKWTWGANFVIARGDRSVRIGDGAPVWKKRFKLHETANADMLSGAYMIFMVKGLVSTAQRPEVKINSNVVGSIFPAEGADRKHWFTQIINIGSGHLVLGPPNLRKFNEIEVHAVRWPGSESGNVFDDFFIRDVVINYNVRHKVESGLF